MSRTPFKTLADLPDFKPGDVVYALVTGGRGPKGLPGPRDVPVEYLSYQITEVFYTEYGLGCRLNHKNGVALDPAPYQGYVLVMEQEDGVYPFFMPEAAVTTATAYDELNISSYQLAQMWKDWLAKRMDSREAAQAKVCHDHQMIVHDLLFIDAEEDFLTVVRDMLEPRRPKFKSKKEKKHARPEKQFDNSHPRSPRARRA